MYKCKKCGQIIKNTKEEIVDFSLGFKDGYIDNKGTKKISTHGRHKNCGGEIEKIMPQEKCLKCGEPLFNKVPLNRKHMAINSDHPYSELEYDNGSNERFFRCKKCGAKNIVTVIGSGPVQIKITDFKEWI